MDGWSPTFPISSWRNGFLGAIPMAIEQYGRYIEQVARWLLDHQKRVREDTDTTSAG
jgi:hypothetical protein